MILLSLLFFFNLAHATQLQNCSVAVQKKLLSENKSIEIRAYVNDVVEKFQSKCIKKYTLQSCQEVTKAFICFNEKNCLDILSGTLREQDIVNLSSQVDSTVELLLDPRSGGMSQCSPPPQLVPLSL